MQNKANFRKGKMMLSVYMKGDYEEFCGFWRRENKANRRLLAGNPKPEILNKTNKCGMIALKTHLKGYNLKNKLVPSASSGKALSSIEWSQFENRQNEHKYLYIRGL